jgi:hypothetical protein
MPNARAAVWHCRPRRCELIVLEAMNQNDCPTFLPPGPLAIVRSGSAAPQPTGDAPPQFRLHRCSSP